MIAGEETLLSFLPDFILLTFGFAQRKTRLSCKESAWLNLEKISELKDP